MASHYRPGPNLVDVTMYLLLLAQRDTDTETKGACRGPCARSPL